MEHQTCTSLGGWGESLIAHELAHMWWGDMITCRDFHHIWLNEGLATYLEIPPDERATPDPGAPRPDLLASLVRDGLRIVEFRELPMNLEDVFLKVTEGKVA